MRAFSARSLFFLSRLMLVVRTDVLTISACLHAVDLTDTTNLVYIVSSVQPTEIYNLAAQSHVKVSFDMAEYTVRSVLPFYLLRSQESR